ncbi:MAG: EAL domain-containing protein [Candidatus Dormibacteria bacterium]
MKKVHTVPSGYEQEVHGEVATMIVDEVGIIEHANEHLLRLGGWDLKMLVGKVWYDALVPVNVRMSVAQRFGFIVNVRNEPHYVEAPLITPNGQQRIIAWTFTAQHETDLEPFRWRAVGIDVTHWIKERDLLVARIDYETVHDPLTGLMNGVTFRGMVDTLIRSAIEREEIVGVILLNIDRFRSIDEIAGREIGDSLLFEVAQRIKRCRGNDIIARWGGDEFTIAVSGIRTKEEVEAAARHIAEHIHSPYHIDGRSFHLHTRIGLSVAPHDGARADDLMQHVSVAVDVAKTLRGDHIVSFSEALGRQIEEQVVLEQELHGAIERGEIVVVYQAQVDAVTREVVGVEALARWYHSRLGEISPTVFIPIAEGIGLIRTLGLHILRESLLQAKQWREMGYPPFRMAVNISPRQLGHPTFVHDVFALLATTDTDPRFLELELTESAVMEDMESATEVLQSLARSGISIALDDFGTGYSCLAYLDQLQVSTIKLDRIFLRSSSHAKDPNALLRGLIALGKALDLRIVAEGVENEEHIARLDHEGADVYQGFFFSRPLTVDEVTRLLDQYGVKSEFDKETPLTENDN